MNWASLDRQDSSLSSASTSVVPTAFTFQSVYWGESGYDGIKKYAKMSTEFFKELLNCLEERCEMELSYSKNLKKLAQRLTKACKETLGNLDNAWTGVADEMEAESEVHKSLSETMIDELVKPLKALFDSQSKSKKEIEVQVGKTSEKLSKKRSEQFKYKRKSYLLAKDTEKIQKSVSEERRRSVRLMNQKQVSKLQSKRLKLEESNLEADKSYHESCINSERSRQELELEIAYAAHRLETLEEQRLNQFQTSLRRYKQCLGAAGPELARVCGQKVPESFYNIDVKADLQLILAQSRPPKVPSRIWVLCDFYPEDFSRPICPERRRESLQRYQTWFEKDLEKERRQKENLDNLSYAFSSGSRTKNVASFVTRINDTCQMMNFLDYHLRRLQNAMDLLNNKPPAVHPLSRYQERIKDKVGLRQSILKIPIFACKSLNIPPALATMNLVRDSLAGGPGSHSRDDGHPPVPNARGDAMVPDAESDIYEPVGDEDDGLSSSFSTPAPSEKGDEANEEEVDHDDDDDDENDAEYQVYRDHYDIDQENNANKAHAISDPHVDSVVPAIMPSSNQIKQAFNKITRSASKSRLINEVAVKAQAHQEEEEEEEIPEEPQYVPSSESSGVSSGSGRPVRRGWSCCKVLYDYAAIRDDELSLHENEVVEILDKSHGAWWRGRKSNQKMGYFPSNYVRII